MAAGKNPYLRYRILNRCFTHKQKRYWTKQELIDKLAEHDLFVEARTLNNDLEAMRHDKRLGFHAPIIFCRKEYAYHYSDPEYSIDSLPITPEELRSLAFAVTVVRQYKGTQVVRDFEGAVDKIARVVDHLGEERHQHGHDFIAFETAPYCQGIEYLDKLREAILDSKSLCIRYQKFTDKNPEEHVFHAYFLKEYKSRWYVLGHSEKRHALITLALDRIVQIADAASSYRANTHLKPQEYFRHTIGITHVRGPVKNILLRFSQTQSGYIKTQPLHDTQQIMDETKEGLTIQLKLKINYELISLLLSYGPEVEVLEPEELRESVREKLKRALGM